MSECRHCFRDHDPDAMCWPPVANERSYGDPDEEFGWSGRTDRLESFILDITNPHQDTRRGAPGFVIEEAKAVTARLRDGFASGELTAADLAATPQAPTPHRNTWDGSCSECDMGNALVDQHDRSCSAYISLPDGLPEGIVCGECGDVAATADHVRRLARFILRNNLLDRLPPTPQAPTPQADGGGVDTAELRAELREALHSLDAGIREGSPNTARSEFVKEVRSILFASSPATADEPGGER